MPLNEFRLDTLIRFIKDVDPRDQVENPAPTPFVPAGTTGEVIEVTTNSIIIHLDLPDKPLLRLYDKPLAECDCSLEAIEPLPYSRSFAEGKPDPPQGFTGKPDPHLDSAADAAVVDKIRTIWPDEEL